MPTAAKLLNLDWSTWVYGMWVAIITGSSNSVIAGLTLKLMDDTVFNRETGTMFSYIGVLFVVGAVKDFFLYINKHPAPEIISQAKSESTQVTHYPIQGTGDGLTKTITTKTEEKLEVTPANPPKD